MFSAANCSTDEMVRAGPRDLLIQQFRVKKFYDLVFIAGEIGVLLWQHFVCNKNKNFLLRSVIVGKIQPIEYFSDFYLALNI
jgi:hypothetical protein